MACLDEHGAIGARGVILPLRARKDGGEQEYRGSGFVPPLAREEARDFARRCTTAQTLEMMRGGIVMIETAGQSVYMEREDVNLSGMARAAGGRSFQRGAADARDSEPMLNASGEVEKRCKLTGGDSAGRKVAPSAPGKECARKLTGGLRGGKRLREALLDSV